MSNEYLLLAGAIVVFLVTTGFVVAVISLLSAILTALLAKGGSGHTTNVYPIGNVHTQQTIEAELVDAEEEEDEPWRDSLKEDES